MSNVPCVCQLKWWLLQIQWHSWQAHGKRDGSNEMKRTHHNSFADPRPMGGGALYWQHQACINAEGHKYIYICSSINSSAKKEKKKAFWFCSHQTMWGKNSGWTQKFKNSPLVFFETAWSTKHALTWFCVNPVNHSSYVYKSWYENKNQVVINPRYPAELRWPLLIQVKNKYSTLSGSRCQQHCDESINVLFFSFFFMGRLIIFSNDNHSVHPNSSSIFWNTDTDMMINLMQCVWQWL